jgi:hypothetical protein
MTSVEWLENEMQKTYIFNQNDFDMFKQAKEMEKEQITDGYNEGKTNGMDISHPLSLTKEISAEQYYNETFNK